MHNNNPAGKLKLQSLAKAFVTPSPHKYIIIPVWTGPQTLRPCRRWSWLACSGSICRTGSRALAPWRPSPGWLPVWASGLAPSHSTCWGGRPCCPPPTERQSIYLQIILGKLLNIIIMSCFKLSNCAPCPSLSNTVYQQGKAGITHISFTTVTVLLNKQLGILT